MSDLSYANLRCHYQTGRSYVISPEKAGTGSMDTEQASSVTLETSNRKNGARW